MLAACPNLSPTSAMEAHCDGCAGTHLVHSKSSAPVCFLQDLISLSPLGSPGHLCTPPLQQKNMRSTRSTPTHGTHEEPCTSPVPNHIHGDPKPTQYITSMGTPETHGTRHYTHGDPTNLWHNAPHPWEPHKPMAQCTISMRTPNPHNASHPWGPQTHTIHPHPWGSQTHGTTHHIHGDPKLMATPNPWHNAPHPWGPRKPLAHHTISKRIPNPQNTPHPWGPHKPMAQCTTSTRTPNPHNAPNPWGPQTHGTTHHIHGDPKPMAHHIQEDPKPTQHTAAMGIPNPHNTSTPKPTAQRTTSTDTPVPPPHTDPHHHPRPHVTRCALPSRLYLWRIHSNLITIIFSINCCWRCSR